MSQLQLLYAVTTPFGRCNRSGLLHITCLVVGIQIGIALLIWAVGLGYKGTVANVLECAFIWIGFCVGAKRLHDLGLSAWWIPAAMVLMILWTFMQTMLMLAVFGAAILNPQGPVFWLSVAGAMSPILAAAVWLHFAKGNPQTNKYGPTPSEFGFSDTSAQSNTPALGS